MPFTITAAEPADAAAIAAVRTAAAEALTRRHGTGHWSLAVTAASVAHGFDGSHVLVARRAGAVIGSLRLTPRQPWADTTRFTAATRPLYLHDMAVAPDLQQRGVGRALIAAAIADARAWAADAIRLDAYDHPAGAGPFYVKCGFRDVGRGPYRGASHVYFERLL